MTPALTSSSVSELAWGQYQAYLTLLSWSEGVCSYLSADEVDLGQQTQQISLCARVSLVPLLWTGSVLGFTCYQTGFNQQISSHRPSRVTRACSLTNQTYLHNSRTHLRGLHVSHEPAQWAIFTHQQYTKCLQTIHNDHRLWSILVCSVMIP